MYFEGQQEKALHGMAEEETERGGSIWDTEETKIRGARVDIQGTRVICHLPTFFLLFRHSVDSVKRDNASLLTPRRTTTFMA